ncbi:hypothetical protein ACJIZ3_003605 [Penstemon smallii]|uniref:Uncharacterized protein n=1 Tax=Penstemon smallii TaxID=265156 RepID=A0ABD3UD38_9LAMI
MGSYSISSSIKAVCVLVFVLASTTSSQNTRCPFDLLYHLGDGVFDNGNAIANMRHGSRLPAAKLPYGNTHPGNPTGRWSDGLLDIDYGAQGLGFPEITAYLSENVSSANAIMFAVARSPVLDSTFFTSRGIRIPPYTVSLSVQMSWFKKYLSTICSTRTYRANKLANALFLFGDVEANDITYSLIQGKSLQQVRSYIPMGATRVILPGNAPLGCYPFILAELASANPAYYDNMGCLKSVNDLIVLKNNDLQQAIESLRKEFPSKNFDVEACCGIGGKYNYDSKRFCGSPGVPVCSNPNKYFFWDGIHLTQETNNHLSTTLAQVALATLNCTVS